MKGNNMSMRSRRLAKPVSLFIAAIICTAALSLTAASSAPSSQTPPKGPYLGQSPPGTTPKIFAPGFISTEAHEFSCSFTPDGQEFYFTRRDPILNVPVIMATRCVDGTWTDPEVVPFVENLMSFEPRVTPGGLRLFFTWGQPLPGQQGPPMNVWYVDRAGGGWGEPQNPGPPLNPMKAMYVSVTSAGTIYTTDISEGPGVESIAVARLSEGKYATLERLGAPINVGARDMYPYVAPDESYLIFSSRRGTGGQEGLFVSFRTADGKWGDPQAIELGMPAGLPLVSPDGKYLFFTAGERGKSDIYWVEATFIKK